VSCLVFSVILTGRLSCTCCYYTDIVWLLCSTLKSNCPVFIRLLATHVNERPVLKVTKVNLDHNQEVAQKLNDMLPQNRRLTAGAGRR